MKYDYFAFLKKEGFDNKTLKEFENNDNLYFFHAKQDKLFNKNPNKGRSLYFSNNKREYSLSDDFLSQIIVREKEFLKIFSLRIKLTSPFFTASENQFYSIQNPIAKERPTGLPVFKGSSFKGALRQAAIDMVEDELLDKNYGEILEEYESKNEDEIIEAEGKDRFFFKKREQLVKLFGNEKDVRWFTFKTLLATGGIKDVSKTKEILDKISNAFEDYLRKSKITDKEGNCKGRLVFEDIHFKKVTLDVITPLSREKRIPVHGPIFYEVVPEGEFATTSILWFPFDLIASSKENINDEWENDKKLIKNALNKLKEKGIGAKTKNGWGRFKWEEIS